MKFKNIFNFFKKKNMNQEATNKSPKTSGALVETLKEETPLETFSEDRDDDVITDQDHPTAEDWQMMEDYKKRKAESDKRMAPFYAEYEKIKRTLKTFQ